MGYNLNSARDSRGDEHLYVEDFNKNRAAIEAYKRQHGGDLEGAYRAVTGRPWPSGRSVKISNGRPEMTKDRTVGSVLGKYVAPIGAGALTALTLGGGAPVLAGVLGGGGTAGGAAAGGGAAMAGKGILSGIAKFGGALAPILGGAAGSRADARSSEISDQFRRDLLDQAATRGNFDMGMRAREFGMKAPQYRIGTGARASLAMADPVKINWGGPGSGLRGEKASVTGGFMQRDPRLRQLANSVMDGELQSQLSGKDNFTAPEMQGATPAPKTGFGDKALGWGAGITGILGALGPVLNKNRPTTQGAPILPGVNSDPNIWRKVQF